MSRQLGSFWRIVGASGSFEIVSGRITYCDGSLAIARTEARSERSVVMASQRPVKKALRHSSEFSNTTDSYLMFFGRKKSSRFWSVVVPGSRQIAAPVSSLALFTLSFAGAIRPWPS